MVDRSEKELTNPSSKGEQQQSQAVSANRDDEYVDHEANDVPIQSASGAYLSPRSPKPSRNSLDASALSAPSTPTSHATSLPSPVPSPRAPEPPRWRFVSEAKKSSGYSSTAAGTVVIGISSDELGAKYVPPKIISKYKSKEVQEVGKLNIVETKNDGTAKGLRSCLRTFTCNGKVTDSDDENDIGDVEVGSDCDRRSAAECAAVSDGEQLKEKETNVEGEGLIGGEENKKNNSFFLGVEGLIGGRNKKRKSFILGVLLAIVVFTMILGIVLGTQSEDGDMQSSQAMNLNEQSSTNNTASPSPTLNVMSVASSSPPMAQSMVRIHRTMTPST